MVEKFLWISLGDGGGGGGIIFVYFVHFEFSFYQRNKEINLKMKVIAPLRSQYRWLFSQSSADTTRLPLAPLGTFAHVIGNLNNDCLSQEFKLLGNKYINLKGKYSHLLNALLTLFSMSPGINMSWSLVVDRRTRPDTVGVNVKKCVASYRPLQPSVWNKFTVLSGAR